MGFLTRDSDRPAPHEETVIANLRAESGRILNECRTAIGRAHLRQQAYLARGDLRSAEIEGSVKDRRLDEMRACMTPPQVAAADKVIAEKSDDWRSAR